jgi:2-oxoisovalerate dehydrogenase E2 component (dihydrolipoyl transacylase)
MPQSFAMPDVGEGLTEAEIVQWRVAVGEVVTVNQILVEVETAKAVVELPSPYAGTVTELCHGAGDVVLVGQPIIVISDEIAAAPASPTPAGSATPASLTPAGSALPAGTEIERQPVLVGYGTHDTSVARRPRRPAPALPQTRPLREARSSASPPVRKLARQLGVDLDALIPSGERGQVTRSDVIAASEVKTTALPAADPAEIRTPVRGIRKQIADAMVRSAFTAPHVTEWLTVDVTRTLRLLEQLRAEFNGLRLTPLSVLARATLLSLARHPEINARWDTETNEIVRLQDVNLGIAVASPRGLIVPNIPAAQTMRFQELAEAMNNLITDARANHVTPDRMRGGTFTITNIGVFGVDGATPIINPGESAILCIGQIQQRPWNYKSKVALRHTTTLSLSFDHRVVDGELGSKTLADIGRLLERPDHALAW